MSEEKGFEVNDRRKTNVEGGEPEAGAAGAAKEEEHIREIKGEDDMQPIDFIAFISSLAATALMHLGEKLSPDQPDGMKNLAGAKQMIDLLDLLKAKTSGNLAKEEIDMLDNILYNLRMRYVMETTGKRP
jgi:hypothetical protein